MRIVVALLLVVVLTLPLVGYSQTTDGGDEGLSFNTPNYKTALGLRVGGTSGLTFKHFFGGSTAFEGIVGVWPNALGFTGLIEKHVPAFDVDGLNWYYGGGGHIVAGTERVYYEGRRYDRGDELGLGVDGMLGIEYKIPPIPFAVSLDLKPFIEVQTDGDAFLALDPGLGVKVAF